MTDKLQPSEIVLEMTPAEIVANYRQAKFKVKQIGILADLNLCKKSHIVNILRAAGETLPGQYRKRAEPKPEAGSEAETPSAEAEERRTDLREYKAEWQLSAEELRRFISEQSVADVTEVLADGKPARYIRLTCFYDAREREAVWTLDISPDDESLPEA